MEFETEYYNDAEEAVQHMQFEPGEGEPPNVDEEANLKMVVMGIYNSRLTSRVERKRVIFEHDLLEYKRIQKEERVMSRDEQALLLKLKPYARLMKRDDFRDFAQDLLYEHNLRQSIAILQEWRRMQITDFKAGEKYEQEKHARMQRLASGNAMYDRFAVSQRSTKALPAVETPPAIAALTAPALPDRSKVGGKTPALSTPSQAATGTTERKALTNGDVNLVNGAPTPLQNRAPPYDPKFPANASKFNFDQDPPTDLHILTKDEQIVCSQLRICPKPYIMMKESVIREAQRHGGALKKKSCREICRIDSTKAGKLYDFWMYSGWISQTR